jgi:rhodanese-related sulfurtransferase
MDFFSRLFGSPAEAMGPADVQAKLSQKDKPFVLDVRQPEEYRTGHIPGSKLIPLGELQQHLGELPRDREIICVCQSGSRSSSATRMLSSAGFQAVNMRGGMIGWSRAGLPVKKSG